MPVWPRASLHHLVRARNAARAAFLALDADQRRARVAELLQRDLAHAKASQRAAQLLEPGGSLLGADLHRDAALEIDAEVEAHHGDRQQGEDVDRGRQAE